MGSEQELNEGSATSSKFLETHPDILQTHGMKEVSVIWPESHSTGGDQPTSSQRCSQGC